MSLKGEKIMHGKFNTITCANGFDSGGKLVFYVGDEISDNFSNNRFVNHRY